jgi:hypothetical protein
VSGRPPWPDREATGPDLIELGDLGPHGPSLLSTIAGSLYWLVLAGLFGGMAMLWTGNRWYLVGALAGGLAIICFKLWSWRHPVPGSVVRVSDAGIEQYDARGLRARARWEDIVEVRDIPTALDPKLSGPRRSYAGHSASTWINLRMGITGWGELREPEPTEKVDWEWQKLLERPPGPDGRRFIAIQLGRYEQSWRRGPVGERLWQARPDLRNQRGDLVF